MRLIPVASLASLLGVLLLLNLPPPFLELADGEDVVLGEVSRRQGEQAPEGHTLGAALGVERRVLGGDELVEGDLVRSEVDHRAISMVDFL